MKTLSATVTQVEKTSDINKHLTQHPLGIYSMVSQFLGLPHVIKTHEGVALGFSTWQQPPSFLRYESHFMTCPPIDRKQAANRCTDAAGGLQVSTGLQAAYHFKMKPR